MKKYEQVTVQIHLVRKSVETARETDIKNQTKG